MCDRRVHRLAIRGCSFSESIRWQSRGFYFRGRSTAPGDAGRRVAHLIIERRTPPPADAAIGDCARPLHIPANRAQLDNYDWDARPSVQDASIGQEAGV
jgi:hypothetical protein